MQCYIELPVSRWEIWGSAVVVVSVLGLIAVSPIEPAYRAILATAALLIAGFQVGRYFSQRPHALQVDVAGQWVLHTRPGRVTPVQRLTPGIVEPWLVSLRCRTGSGNRLDLVVPGSVISAQQHWRLRREILGFRSSDNQPGGRLG